MNPHAPTVWFVRWEFFGEVLTNAFPNQWEAHQRKRQLDTSPCDVNVRIVKV